MKKSILVLLAALSMNVVVAQNTNPASNNPQGNKTYPEGNKTQTQQNPPQNQNVRVPDAVSKRFTTDYPDNKSVWTMSGNNYRAEYMDKDTRSNRAILYDNTGNPIGTEKELMMNDYPVTLRDYYKTNYPNETYKVWIREDNSGKRTYYVPRNNEMIWFDEKGNYKTKNSTPGDKSRNTNNNMNNNHDMNNNHSDHKH